ncbi:LRR domain containing protein [Trema orientale]|uniref:LRR domain containing protein n=1 Tax=Trema orientale TaxID=63057 RepID=A0A2P5FAE8_TREOI|nr:LRR domain containing protein [Trema orientale]
MAEAFLSALLENLNSLIQRKIGSLLGVEKQMEKFSSTLSTMRSVLEDAEERQLGDQAIKDWLKKLSDVSSELDDILDDCETEAFRLEYQGQEHHRWTQRLDQIANERMKFHLREVVGERRSQIRQSRQTSSIITQPRVYGREEDKERIVGNEILGNVVSITLSNCRNCSELPPFGELTSLRDLSISGMNFVRYIDNESHDGDLRRGFECLESLNIADLPNLERFSRQEGKELFPSLRSLSSKKCPKLTLLGPGFASLETLYVEDSPNFEFSGRKGKEIFPCLSTLYAKNCEKLTLVGQVFPCLQSLHIDDLPNLELSMHHGKEMFPCLSRLHAKNCRKLTLRGHGFACLESLHIEDLPNLELSMQDGKEMFPCLSRLYVGKCPKLALPVLGLIKDLQVYESNELVLNSISNLPGLTQLRISDNANMTSFPECMLRNLTSLQSLTIDRLPNLEELPTDMLIGLSALEALDISFCNELKCLPEGIFRGSALLKRISLKGCRKMKLLPESFRGLTMLQSLEIIDCSELEGFPTGLNNLISLKLLTMLGLEMYTSGRNGWGYVLRAVHKLVALPGALQHLPSLESIRVSYFLGLASLPDWLGNLATLKELCVEGCPDLASIPSSIKNLTNLRKLTIESCPKLEKRFENEAGEDWQKIAHIPEVYIGPSGLTSLLCAFKWWSSVAK